MEEDLDDFFAKKDKSKKKPGKNAITPDDIKSMLDKKLGKAAKKKRDADNASKEPLSVRNIEDDGEWKDIEIGAEEVDYSGLRIQKLQLTKDDLDGRDNNEDDNNENCRSNPGPWKPISQPIPQPLPEPTEIVAPASAPKTGKYIPPGARNLTTNSGTKAAGGQNLTPIKLGAGKGRSKHAPDMHSVEDFPSLEASNIISDQGIDPSMEFERVSSGKRNNENISSKGPDLSLGNKYGSLIEDNM